MNDFFEVVERQRAHRQFLDKPIDDAVINKLLNAAIRAPSAENRQPWEFIVVRDARVRAALGEIMLRAWEGGAKQWSQTRLNEKMLADVDAGMHGGVAGAPVLIVVCGNTQRGMEITLGASVFPAVQNLLLAATALQLGSALTTIATHYQKELQDLLKLPSHVKAMAIVPIGYPARALGKSRRNPLESCTHNDEFGKAWE